MPKPAARRPHCGPMPPTGVSSAPGAASEGRGPLPCPPGLLCGYLSALAERGLRASSIGRRASGIAHQHKLAGLEPPTNSEAVKTVIRGIRRERGTAPRKKAPATADIIGALLGTCGDRLIDHRDRALLALGFLPGPSAGPNCWHSTSPISPKSPMA